MRVIPEAGFTNGVSTVPLVSIDLCIFFGGLLLLVKGHNRPAKVFYFRLLDVFERT
jgi:hypothetical protein